MRKSGISKIALLILSVSLLTGCDILTFSGKKTTRWKNNIVHQTIQWDVNATEEDVKRNFTAFLRETLLKNRYKDYQLLFQSNYRLEEQERTYLFKIFRNNEEKNAFLIKSEDIISRTRALAGSSFNDRWGQLQRNTPVEKVYELLPELADFNAPQLLYLDHTELHLADLWLSFDLRGYLIDFGKGNQPATPQRDEKWVF
jgi:hypothetical protein